MEDASFDLTIRTNGYGLQVHHAIKAVKGWSTFTDTLNSGSAKMVIHTLAYTPSSGWSVPEFPREDSLGTLILAFGASRYLVDQAPFQAIKKAYPNSLIAGCSTSGEINGEVIADESISVAVVRFEDTEIAIRYAKVENAGDSFVAGVALANRLEGSSLKCAFVLSDGMTANGSELTRGLNSIFTDKVVVAGGMAGDGTRFSSTWILKDGLPVSGYACAIGLYGDKLLIGHGADGSWAPFGPERLVTRSHGNILYELDGRPALELYREYLGDEAASLPASGLFFPLAVQTSSEGESRRLRTVISVLEEEGAIAFGGDIPQGSGALLVTSNAERLIHGAQNAADQAVVPHSGAVLGIAISSVARRRVLQDKAEDEVAAVFDRLPIGSSLLGFYSYGEISPSGNGRSDLHNQTMALTTLLEAA